MTEGFQTADYVLCGLTLAMAALGLFRGFSGTLGFFLAVLAAGAAGSIGWACSSSLTSVTWLRAGGVLVVTLLVFGLVRLLVKKLVGKLLSQPSDALFGMLAGALIGALVVLAWARSGLYPDFSRLVREVAAYVR